MSRRGFGSFAAVLLGTMVVVHAADGVRITPIMREKKVLVSFELTDAYDEAVRQSISSGLRTTFSYDVALRVVAWVDAHRRHAVGQHQRSIRQPHASSIG
jgi:hypothetical protein